MIFEHRTHQSINLLIAQKIFGYKFPTDHQVREHIKGRKINWQAHPDGQVHKYWGRLDCNRTTGFYFWKEAGRLTWMHEVPNYSNDEGVAFDLVVRHLRCDGFSFKLWQPACETGSEMAKVSFICSRGPCPKHKNHRNNHHGAYEVESDTVAMAICKAALIAKKVIRA